VLTPAVSGREAARAKICIACVKLSFQCFSGEIDQLFFIIFRGGFVAGDFLAQTALVEDNVAAGFNLQADRFH